MRKLAGTSTTPSAEKSSQNCCARKEVESQMAAFAPDQINKPTMKINNEMAPGVLRRNPILEAKPADRKAAIRNGMEKG